MNKEDFYEKLKANQTSSLYWNDVVESIISIYNSHFILSDQIFSSEELWDFLFTKRDDHFAYHNKIWSTFINDKYYKLFEIIYIALDDPEPEWWNIQFK
jgi:hypothetical protein